MEKVYCKNCKYYYAYDRHGLHGCTQLIDTRVINEFNNETISGAVDYISLDANKQGTCEHYKRKEKWDL